MIKKAIDYRLKAAHQAIERSAMLEAEAQLSKGSNLLASLPEDRERQQRELDFRSTLIVAQMHTQGYAAPAVAETITRERQLYEQLHRSPQFTNVLYVPIVPSFCSRSFAVRQTTGRLRPEQPRRWDRGALFCRTFDGLRSIGRANL